MSAKRNISELAKRTLIVLVDLDETLAAFERHFLTKYREKYADEPFIPLDKRNTFYVADQYESLNFKNETVKTKLKDIYREKYFFRDLPEIEGACEAVKEMAEMSDVEVFICSSPIFQYIYSAPEKYEWVESHLGKDWISRVILTRDKTVVNGHVLIDDKVHIKGALKKPAWEHIVFTACHNKTMDLRGKNRLDNWTDGTWRTIIEDFKKRL